MAPSVSIALLGGFRLVYDQTPIDTVNQPRQQSLLAYLALHRHSVHSRRSLAFMLWPESSEAQARTNLRKLLYTLRHVLPQEICLWDDHEQAISWSPAIVAEVDATCFEQALDRAREAAQAGLDDAARAATEEALAIYDGDLLPSCYDDWILPLRERLRELYAGALELLSDLAEKQHDYRSAVQHARSVLHIDPLSESAYRRLMHLHVLNGDRAGALHTYRACVTTLQAELQVEPSLTTRRLYERIVAAGEVVSTEPGPFSLTARDREWAQLMAAWRRASAGRPQLLLISGEAGMGKTGLIEALHHWAGGQGIRTALARCYGAEGELAYAPAVAWLRANPPVAVDRMWLADIECLLPEIHGRRPGAPDPLPCTDGDQRHRLFEALSRAILGPRSPMLLILDDAHACDEQTLQWLHYLLRFDPRASLLVVATRRPEETAASAASLSLLTRALARERLLTAVDLAPLTEAQTADLAGRLAGRPIDTAHAVRLYKETGGNPLFVVAAMSDPDATDARQPLDTPSVQTVIDEQLAALSARARDVLVTAAVVGPDFSYEMLYRAIDLDEAELVEALDELLRRRIVRETGADSYAFAYARLQQVVVERLSAARRRLEARRVAHAMHRALRSDGWDTTAVPLHTGAGRA